MVKLTTKIYKLNFNSIHTVKSPKGNLIRETNQVSVSNSSSIGEAVCYYSSETPYCTRQVY